MTTRPRVSAIPSSALLHTQKRSLRSQLPSGTVQDKQFGKLDWRSPDSSLHACWWITNAHSAPQEPARLLVKSLAVLRAELHRTRVATLSSVSAEIQRRAVHNSRVRTILESNPQWRAAAGPVQRRLLTGTMSTGANEYLHTWSQEALC